MAVGRLLAKQRLQRLQGSEEMKKRSSGSEERDRDEPRHLVETLDNPCPRNENKAKTDLSYLTTAKTKPPQDQSGPLAI